MCEYPDFQIASEPVARKQYFCETCGFPIPKGERHAATRMKFDGKVSTYRQHSECSEAERHVYYGTGDECALEYGFREHIREARRRGWDYWSKKYEPMRLTEYDQTASNLVAQAMWRNRHLMRAHRNANRAKI